MENAFYEYYRDFSETIYFEEKEDCVSPLHFHRNLELHYTVSGKMTGWIDDNVYTFRKNDIALIPSYMQHKFMNDGHSVCMSYIIPHNFILEYAPYLKNNIYTTPLVDREYNRKFVLPLFKYLLNLSSSTPQLTDRTQIIKGLSIAMIGCVQAHYKPEKPDKTKNNAEVISQILEYIENNYRTKITLSVLAETFGYSRDHFSKMFIKHIHYSLPDYLNSVRVEHVINLFIQNGFKDLLDAIYECGFNSPSTFYRAFNKRYNTSPQIFFNKLQKH